MKSCLNYLVTSTDEAAGENLEKLANRVIIATLCVTDVQRLELT